MNEKRLPYKAYLMLLHLDEQGKKNSLIKFRFGVSPIVVHSLRYKTHAYIDTICPLSRAAVENEVHFALV